MMKFKPLAPAPSKGNARQIYIAMRSLGGQDLDYLKIREITPLIVAKTASNENAQRLRIKSFNNSIRYLKNHGYITEHNETGRFSIASLDYFESVQRSDYGAEFVDNSKRDPQAGLVIGLLLSVFSLALSLTVAASFH